MFQISNAIRRTETVDGGILLDVHHGQMFRPGRARSMECGFLLVSRIEGFARPRTAVQRVKWEKQCNRKSRTAQMTPPYYQVVFFQGMYTRSPLYPERR